MIAPSPGSPADVLAGLVETWRRACSDLVALAREIPESDWHRPTDLAGWDVKDNVAHTAHLEAVLVGMPEETLEVPDAPHVKGPMNYYCEQGVLARRDRDMAELADRPLDVWMHEQDVRRLPMVVGKRVAPPIGATLRLLVPEAGLGWSVRVGEDGRAARVSDDGPAEVTVTLSPEDLVVLGGGRRGVEDTHPRVEGDEDLGRRLPASLAVTP